jgi:hypothetical protein
MASYLKVDHVGTAEDLLKLGRHQLKTVVMILTGHTPVRKHLRSMGLFEGDPTCRFCRKEVETVQYICCCEALACQRYNVFESLVDEPTDIRYVQPQLGTSASSYEAWGYRIWAE